MEISYVNQKGFTLALDLPMLKRPPPPPIPPPPLLMARITKKYRPTMTSVGARLIASFIQSVSFVYITGTKSLGAIPRPW